MKIPFWIFQASLLSLYHCMNLEEKVASYMWGFTFSLPILRQVLMLWAANSAVLFRLCFLFSSALGVLATNTTFLSSSLKEFTGLPCCFFRKPSCPFLGFWYFAKRIGSNSDRTPFLFPTFSSSLHEWYHIVHIWNFSIHLLCTDESDFIVFKPKLIEVNGKIPNSLSYWAS